MVAKKNAAPTAPKASGKKAAPKWGNKKAEPEQKPAAPAPEPQQQTADDSDIPAFLKRDAAKQTDIEDFTGSPEPSPAGDQAAAPAESPSPATALPPHDPETGELSEESTQTSDTAMGGDGRPLSPTDNQPRTATVHDDIGGTVAGKQLLAFVERVERLNEEKDTIQEDIKEVFAEMKGTGFDTATVRRLIALRRMDQAKRQEQESILDLYKAAIGMA